MSHTAKTVDTATEDKSESSSTAVDNHYFYEDLVYKIRGKKVCFGIVVDNFEDYNSDSEDNDFESSPIPKGSVRVSWYPRRLEQVVKEQMVGLADRSLMPGDVVRKLVQDNPSDTQHGYCREITVCADVQQVQSQNVLCNVAYSRMVPLNRFELDLVVCLGPWVGTVKEHFTLMTLAVIPNIKSHKTNIIGRLEFTHSNNCHLKPVEKRSRHYDDCDDCEHHVGQILTGKICGMKRWRWVSGCPTESEPTSKRYHFIVESIKTVAVGVRWHCQSCLETTITENVHQPPDYLISGVPLESLKVLNVFEACTAQVGDRRFLKVNDLDTIISKRQWIKTQSRKFRQLNSLNVSSSQMSLKPPGLVPTENNIHLDASDEEEWSTDESECSFASGSTSSGAAACSTSKKKRHVLATKVLKRKIKKDRKARPVFAKAIADNTEPPKPGEPTLVETLSTTSVATVVWQDGTIERNIQSTDLYPIHHLDDQEFFPGDFVIRSYTLSDDSLDLRDYGVIQHMNHAGRTALVKWFRAYSAMASTYNSELHSPHTRAETEMSVYDLKDHPDFNFRPGTVVIRVAGRVTGQSTAGQILDNFPEGRISVKWVDGTQSMCWPQDLYRVGDYDSDEGELWDDDDDISLEVSNDTSWETQSIDSLPGDVSIADTDASLRYRLATNIERSCDAMSRLEDMFTRNPALQGREVMRTLLEVYKDCRYLDKLMGTAIFHERYFTDLLERAKTQDQKTTTNQKIQRHFQRLFSDDNLAHVSSTPKRETFNGQTELDLDACRGNTLGTAIAAGSKSDDVFNVSVKMEKKETEAANFIKENRDKNWKSSSDSTITPIAKTAEILSNIETVQETVKIAFEKVQDTEQVPKDITLENKPAELTLNIKTNPADLTLKTLYEKGASTSTISEEKSPEVKVPICHHSDSIIQNVNACKDLCTLIKARLVIAHAEVLKRLGTADYIQSFKNDSDDEKEEIKKVEDSCDASPISSPSVTTVHETDTSDKDTDVISEGFMVLEHAPMSHKYYLSIIRPSESQVWVRAVRREFRLLNRALPPGVWVRGYEDRLDILSLMIRGPADTPYENGLFFFDIQLGANYPASAPLFHYISYCSDRLNPNLYEDGKVCVSLLGTWSGRGSEVWGSDSTLLQVIVSVQGLILNTEPYYNEAGYEKQRGSALGKENSRMYNEMVTLKLVQAMTKLLQSPPEIFKAEIFHHFKNHSAALLERLENLLVLTNEHNVKMKSSGSQVNIGTNTNEDTTSTGSGGNEEVAAAGESNSIPSVCPLPAFPLIPASKGFCLSLKSSLPIFKDVLKKLNLYSHEQFLQK